MERTKVLAEITLSMWGKIFDLFALHMLQFCASLR